MLLAVTFFPLPSHSHPFIPPYLPPPLSVSPSCLSHLTLHSFSSRHTCVWWWSCDWTSRAADKRAGGRTVWRFQSSVPPSPLRCRQCVEASWRLKALLRLMPPTWAAIVEMTPLHRGKVPLLLSVCQSEEQRETERKVQFDAGEANGNLTSYYAVWKANIWERFSLRKIWDIVSLSIWCSEKNKPLLQIFVPIFETNSEMLTYRNMICCCIMQLSLLNKNSRDVSSRGSWELLSLL